MSIYLRRVNRWLRRAAADPVGSQERTFKDLIEKGSQTAFGQEHGFDKISTPAEFARAVPIQDYVAFLPWIERMLAGEADVSWPGKVPYFAQTSGTTAGDKRIPVTDAMQKSNRRAATAIFAYYKRRGAPLARRVMGGQLLFLGGSTAMEETEGGGMIGDLSGIATQSICWPLTSHYEPGKQIALVSNWEEKIDRVAKRCIDRDLRFVTGMPSWVKVLFDRVCDMRGLDPQGAISVIWPNLELFVHGGVNFAPFRPVFQKYFTQQHNLHFLEVYPASEGFIAIQAVAGEPGMEMLVDNGLFFEFVPLDRWGQPDAPRLTLEQVELDVPYSLVLSTNAGLWAYDIGDVVRFVSLDPPRIVFAGRNKHFINAFGENIIGEQVSSAVAEAAEATGAEVTEFTAAPRYADDAHAVGAHEYVVEFAREPSGGLDAFARRVDQTLQRLNNDYSVKRKGDTGMTSVEVTPVPQGTFYGWMKQRGKLGGQHKVPQCANDRRYVDDVLDYAGKQDGSDRQSASD